MWDFQFFGVLPFSKLASDTDMLSCGRAKELFEIVQVPPLASASAAVRFTEQVGSRRQTLCRVQPERKS